MSLSGANVHDLDEATIAEAVALARDIDREEALYQTGKPLEDALWDTYQMSPGGYAGRLGDELVCVWGVCALAPLEGIGQPWLIATDALNKAAFPFLKHCWYYLNDMKTDYDFLWNVVYEENASAIAWLRWMGFRMTPARKIGPYGKNFIPFEWCKEQEKCVL
jgi:hypothetical protein